MISSHLIALSTRTMKPEFELLAYDNSGRGCQGSPTWAVFPPFAELLFPACKTILKPLRPLKTDSKRPLMEVMVYMSLTGCIDSTFHT